MSDDSLIFYTNEDEFNEKASFICDKPYNEFKKFKGFFEANFKQSGPNTFTPTVAVFSYLKNFVGMITCRETLDKDDLFRAMSEMLFFPMSIGSSLFIIATDVNISQPDEPSITDALVVSYVTPSNCLILTVPYSYDSDNNLTWREDKAFISKVDVEDVEQSTPVGDLIELFYVFSHAETTGPFQYEEVLAFFDVTGFKYEIFNPDNIQDKHVIAVPFRAR